ncbi:hypothetical protein [Sphingomonas sp. Leaf17]|uniref:hypothetical protein n=1 Tax=Sphingomonas sp. Leaf17 TaxID=1735683 RepID=UPI0012E1DBFD|nr:hypothetical protein [Sphingomonas sp. Leaf17]
MTVPLPETAASVQSRPWFVLPARPSGRALWARAGLFAVWLMVVALLVSQHVFWRDEVRAFSLALQGDSLIAMARGVQGEGHPALWYILLRLAHMVVPVREVLPGVAAAIGIVGAAILTFRAPFRLWFVAIVLFGAFGLFEFVVMARNYGISMVVLFAIALAYDRGRDRGILLGLLLLALCNTNAQAIFFAGGILLFWLVEIVCAHGLRPNRAWREWAVAAALTLIGVVLCAVTVYPPFNDAAVSPRSEALSVGLIVQSMLSVAAPFGDLMPDMLKWIPGIAVLLGLLMMGSVLSLIRTPAGLLSGVVVLVALLLFFQLVYPGSYRHQALFLVFVMTIHWLVAQGHGGRWPGDGTAFRLMEGIGQGAFVVLLALQLLTSYDILAGAARGVPFGRAADLAALIHRRGLDDATVMADPDVMVEALPYYADNPIWMVREHKFGRVVRFTRHAQIHLTAGDLLHTAQDLRRMRGKPVVIVIQRRMNPDAPAFRERAGYVGSYSSTPEQVRAFLDATTRIAVLRPARTDEDYAVYLLKDPVTGS